jgi:hypothetical protein
VSLTVAVAVMSLVSALPPFKALESRADRFSVDLPGKPKVEKEKSTVTWSVGSEDGAVLVMVMKDPDYDNLGPEALKVGIDAFRESLAGQGTVSGEQALNLGGIPGLEVKSVGKEEDTIGRMYLGEGRSWTVMCMIEKGKRMEDVGCDRAFSSFKLLDASGKPRAGAPAPAPAASAPAPAAGGQPGPPVVSIGGATMSLAAEGNTFIAALEVMVNVTRAPAGASLRVDAKCKLPKKKSKLVSQVVPITASRGSDVAFNATFKLPAKPESCQLLYFVVVDGKPVVPENGPKDGVVDVSCWPVEGDIFPGPCDQP